MLRRPGPRRPTLHAGSLLGPRAPEVYRSRAALSRALRRGARARRAALLRISAIVVSWIGASRSRGSNDRDRSGSDARRLSRRAWPPFVARVLLARSGGRCAECGRRWRRPGWRPAGSRATEPVAAGL